MPTPQRLTHRDILGWTYSGVDAAWSLVEITRAQRSIRRANRECWSSRNVFLRRILERASRSRGSSCTLVDVAAGYVQSQLKLSFHVGRDVTYYATKVLLPLYLLIVNFAGDFLLPVEDLSSRSANTMTGFLAAFVLWDTALALLLDGRLDNRLSR
eukprot:m.1550423 g.1550423  ORF g.1550423 m.1550423 type:complete len:156 (+) comp25265_c0_seq63:1345-1812(+)